MLQTHYVHRWVFFMTVTLSHMGFVYPILFASNHRLFYDYHITLYIVVVVIIKVCCYDHVYYSTKFVNVSYARITLVIIFNDYIYCTIICLLICSTSLNRG